jgi:hypothetical protein
MCIVDERGLWGNNDPSRLGDKDHDVCRGVPMVGYFGC